jgi:hypothetical protein
MLLQFIADASIGPKERRLIRSHVMKGKNAGRPRPSKRKLGNASISQGDTRGFASHMNHQAKAIDSEAPDYNHMLDLKRILWNDLTLTSFPLHVGPDSRKTIYRGT